MGQNRRIWRTVWEGHPHPQRLSTSVTPIEASQSLRPSTSVRSMNRALASCLQRPSYSWWTACVHSAFHVVACCPAALCLHLRFHSRLTHAASAFCGLGVWFRPGCVAAVLFPRPFLLPFDVYLQPCFVTSVGWPRHAAVSSLVRPLTSAGMSR